MDEMINDYLDEISQLTTEKYIVGKQYVLCEIDVQMRDLTWKIISNRLKEIKNIINKLNY